MNLKALFDRLLRIRGTERSVVTLALDVADSGILPAATRIFLKDRLSEPPPDLRAVTARVRNFVESELRPETHGLFLVAGEEHWEPVELRVRLGNFLRVDDQPYLAPLVEAVERAPKAYIVRCNEREAQLQSTHLGIWEELGRWNAFEVDRDTERLVTGRTPFSRAAGHLKARAGIGGGKRDRFEQTLEAESARSLDSVLRRIAGDHARAPASAAFLLGDAERFPGFRTRLPTPLPDFTDNLTPAPRKETALRDRVQRILERRVLARRETEILEFHDRRRQGHLVALGPADVLSHRLSGRLARIYLDPEDPVLGTHCPSCDTLQAGRNAVCGYCESLTRPVSLTQALVAHALSHPPLPITFVSRPAPWLKELGGMAALLSQKGTRVRR